MAVQLLTIVQMFDGGHMGGMGLMGFWWLLIIGAIVLLWYVLSGTRKSGSHSEESPEEVLKRRYARGEIDAETYEKMLRDLRK